MENDRRIIALVIITSKWLVLKVINTLWRWLLKALRFGCASMNHFFAIKKTNSPLFVALVVSTNAYQRNIHHLASDTQTNPTSQAIQYINFAIIRLEAAKKKRAMKSDRKNLATIVTHTPRVEWNEMQNMQTNKQNSFYK